MKWTKGKLELATTDGKGMIKDGYVSPDTEDFGIHSDCGYWVVSHLASGMKVATCQHLQVAKQVVSDLMGVSDTWPVKNKQLDLDIETVRKVIDIRSAAAYYHFGKGTKPVDGYKEALA